MAEEHVGPRPAAWTRIFSGFKIALDLKKLLLAAAGILATAVGWVFLSWLAFLPFRSGPPQWESTYADRGKTDEEKKAYWTAFKSSRGSWNLLHELAGNKSWEVDPGDLAETLAEYEALRSVQGSYTRNKNETIKIAGSNIDAEGKTYTFTIVQDPKEVLKD